MTIVLARAMGLWSSIQIGTPAAASRFDDAIALAGDGLVGNQANVDAALLGADQRLDYTGAGRQPVGADHRPVFSRKH